MVKKKTTDGASPPAAPEPQPPPDGAAASAEPPQNDGQGAPHRPAFRVGPIATSKDHAVSACVWANTVATSDGRSFTVHNVSVEARYRDGSGEWKTASSFRGSQLHALLYCLGKCADFIFAARDPSADVPF